MKYTEKKALYESIMKDVAKTVKRHLNESGAVRVDDKYLQEFAIVFGKPAVERINSLLFELRMKPGYMPIVMEIIKELTYAVRDEDDETVGKIAKAANILFRGPR